MLFKKKGKQANPLYMVFETGSVTFEAKTA